MPSPVHAPDDLEAIRSFLADGGDAGRRLDLAIVRHVHDVSALSRTQVQAWIADGRVRVNDKRSRRASMSLALGARIDVRLPATARIRVQPGPESGPLEVLFEDDTLLILNKPAGLVAHPSYRNTKGTLLNRVLWHLRHQSNLSTPGLVSRLDKGTSGVVVVALAPGVHRQVQQDAAAGHVRKEYLALVRGIPSARQGRITLPLTRDPADRRRVIPSVDGAASETVYGVLDASEGIALLRCMPITGRAHQIRVHLATSGWPILGDATYGSSHPDLTRPALHALRIVLPHPVSRAVIECHAPLPVDISRVVDALGLTGPSGMDPIGLP